MHKTMNSELQTTNEQNYFLAKREEINNTLLLNDKAFLQNTTQFAKIVELKKDPNFIFLIVGWMAQTSILMQIKNPIDTFIKQDIVNMLTGYWSVLSIEELVKAFELERFGVYKERTDHFQLFDSNYVSKILNKYQEWKRNSKIAYNISATVPPASALIDEKKQQQIRNEFIQHLYREIKEHGYTFDARLLYKELEEKGKIIIGNSKKTELYNKQYDKKLFSLKAKALKGATSEIKDSIHSMVKAQEEGKWVKQVVDECMAISVCEYLSDYLEDINDFKNAL